MEFFHLLLILLVAFACAQEPSTVNDQITDAVTDCSRLCGRINRCLAFDGEEHCVPSFTVSARYSVPVVGVVRRIEIEMDIARLPFNRSHVDVEFIRYVPGLGDRNVFRFSPRIADPGLAEAAIKQWAVAAADAGFIPYAAPEKDFWTKAKAEGIVKRIVFN